MEEFFKQISSYVSEYGFKILLAICIVIVGVCVAWIIGFLLKNFNSFSIEERGVRTAQLDKDLAKALNVAEEIENAKILIESYHTQANRHNFESIAKEKKKDKKDK